MFFMYTAVTESNICRSLVAKSEIQYLFSGQLSNTRCHNYQPPQISSQPGQQINVTIMPLRDEVLSLEGTFIDGSTGDIVPLKRAGVSSSGISSSDVINIMIENTQGKHKFMIGYQGRSVTSFFLNLY